MADLNDGAVEECIFEVGVIAHRFEKALENTGLWAVRARLELADNLRDLALFNVAIDSKLRGCDLVKLAVSEALLHK